MSGGIAFQIHKKKMFIGNMLGRDKTMDEKGKSWSQEANKRWSVISKCFKPKENLIIADFIRTAEEVKEDEMNGKKDEHKNTMS
jgi:hypothetical protein